MQTWDYIYDVTYWGAPAEDGWGGNTFSAPEVRKCRWEGIAERFIDLEGVESISRAIVWIQGDLDLGGYLYLGVSVALDPTVLPDAWPVRMIYKTPSLSGDFVEQKAYL